MKKQILLLGLAALMVGLLSACRSGGNGDSNTDSTDSSGSVHNEDLKLLYFGSKDNSHSVLNRQRKLEDVPDDINYMSYYSEQIPLTLVVTNTNRYSFIDFVLRNNNTNRLYVFNEGNGEYTCSSTTIYSNEKWVTTIEFVVTNYFVDLEQDNDASVSLEITELNFVNFSGNVEKADLNTEDIRTQYFAWDEKLSFFGEAPGMLVVDKELLNKLSAVSSEYLDGDIIELEGKKYIQYIAPQSINIAKFGNRKDAEKGKNYFFKYEKIAWEAINDSRYGNVLVQKYALSCFDGYLSTLPAHSVIDTNYKAENLDPYIQDMSFLPVDFMLQWRRFYFFFRSFDAFSNDRVFFYFCFKCRRIWIWKFVNRR